MTRNYLEGKTALITGTSAGIGKACAELLGEMKVNLILIARRLERLKILKNKLLNSNPSLKITIAKLDIRNRAKVKQFVNKLKKQNNIPDFLINNAGLASGLNKLQEGDFADWDKMIDTNIKGLLNISRFLLPLMLKRNTGHIVNIGSIAGHQVYPCGNVYNATKFAVRALNQAMSVDLVESNIKVSSIDPGRVETEFSLVRFKGNKTKAQKIYEEFTSLSAEDIANAVIYVLNTPPHVNILEMVILPTAQRNIYVVKENS